MILVVGASGRLGGTISRHLLCQGERVRALTRTLARLENLKALGAEVVGGDMRDPASLKSACQGIEQVIEAFEQVLHLHVKVRHLSVPTLRIIQLLARPFNPVLSRQLDMAILLDTDKQSCDMTETLKAFPQCDRLLLQCGERSSADSQGLAAYAPSCSGRCAHSRRIASMSYSSPEGYQSCTNVLCLLTNITLRYIICIS